jgi:hypothetical protein
MPPGLAGVDRPPMVYRHPKLKCELVRMLSCWRRTDSSHLRLCQNSSGMLDPDTHGPVRSAVRFVLRDRSVNQIAQAVVCFVAVAVPGVRHAFWSGPTKRGQDQYVYRVLNTHIWFCERYGKVPVGLNYRFKYATGAVKNSTFMWPRTPSTARTYATQIADFVQPFKTTDGFPSLVLHSFLYLSAVNPAAASGSPSFQ